MREVERVGLSIESCVHVKQPSCIVDEQQVDPLNERWHDEVSKVDQPCQANTDQPVLFCRVETVSKNENI